MAVSRKFSGSRKMLILLYIHKVCCGLFYINIKKTSSVSTCQEFYVCSDVVKAKIFINGFRRRRIAKQRPLANSLKLFLCCRLLLYALYSVFLIKLSGDAEINPGPKSGSNQIFYKNQTVKCHELNARSLMSVRKANYGETVSNLERFQNFVYTEDIDIVFVNETWLSYSINNAEILHAGYTIVRNDQEGRGGEVLFGIRTEIFQSIREIENNYYLEVVLAELTTFMDSKIIICSCYRPPNADRIWMENLLNFLNDVCSRHS